MSQFDPEIKTGDGHDMGIFEVEGFVGKIFDILVITSEVN